MMSMMLLLSLLLPRHTPHLPLAVRTVVLGSRSVLYWLLSMAAGVTVVDAAGLSQELIGIGQAIVANAVFANDTVDLSVCDQREREQSSWCDDSVGGD
jgi:hypothetical protein